MNNQVGERRSFSRNNFHHQQPPRARMEETELSSQVVKTERKEFTIKLAENANGKYVRIIELKNGRRDQVVVPQECRAEFLEALMAVWAE